MKAKKLYALMLAAMFAAGSMALPAAAADYTGGLTQYTIDTNMKGSFTLHKLIENDGNNAETDGLEDTSESRTPVDKIVFSYLKAADFISIAEGGQVGTYFTNIHEGFKNILEGAGYDLEADGNCTKVTARNPETGDEETNTYWTTNQMEKALTYMLNKAGTTTAASGDEVLNAFLKTNGTAMPATDAAGSSSAANLPLGLYLVGETDISAHDGLDANNRPYTIELAKQNEELPIIESLAAPFYICVPTTNITSVNGNPAGTAWLYDLDVYPKNQTNEITKRIVDPDSENGEALRTSEDYQIGDVIRQVIWADVPKLQKGYTNADTRGTLTVDDEAHLKFVITDTMTESLSFDGVTRVAMGPKLASAPEKNDDFKTFTTVFEGGADYTVSETTNQDGSHSFSVAMTDAGLKKLDAITADSQIAVWFDSTLNNAAKIGTDMKSKGNENHPTLTWKNTNTVERTYDGNRVYDYTYELDIRKNGLRDGKNAAFIVQRSHAKDDKSVSGDMSDVYFVQESAGVYHVYDKNDKTHKDTNAAAAVRELRPDQSGSLKIKGLDSDRYTFTETKTEELQGDEKSLLKTTFDVQFTAGKRNDLDGNATCTASTPDGEATNLTVSGGIAKLTVENYKTVMLRTGGEGRTGVYVFGFAVFGATAAAFAYSRKRKAR